MATKKLTAFNQHGREVTVVVPGPDVPDELNPQYIFSQTATALLVEAAAGHIDLNQLAIDMLANRGLDPRTGAWVGFKRARVLADEAKELHGG